ncbi:sensor histidine kinase [Eisenbergiella sp.]
MKQSSIFRRLLLLFSLLVLPVIIIGIGAQWRTNRSVREEIIDSISNRIHDTVLQIDNKFSETNHLCASVLTSGRVNRIANPDDPMSAYERSVNVNSARDYLSSIKLSNPWVNNIRLYLPLLHIYYNADNAFDYRRNSYLGSQGELESSVCRELMSLQTEQRRTHIHDNNLVFLQYSSRSEPHIIVEAVYTAPELKAMLTDTLLYEDAFYYFIPEDPDFLLTNSRRKELFSPAAEGTETVSYFQLEGIGYYAFRYTLSETATRYIQVIPAEEMLMNLSVSTRYSIVFTISVLLFSLFFVFGAFRILKKPIHALTVTFGKIENHEFDTRIENPSLSDFQYLYESFNNMAEKLDDMVQKEFKQALLLQKAQFKQLQAQINPHFLYNSFFMLNQMIAREMNESALELSRELGIYFRYITRNYQEEALLADEYQHVQVYASIQARRFEGRIRIEMDPLPDARKQLMVPKLILQPVLENSFKHGMENKIRDGVIRMKLTDMPDYLQVIIEDNGDSLSPETLSELKERLTAVMANTLEEETTGLLNIAKRLQLFYSSNDIIRAERSPLGGLRITLTLYEKRNTNAAAADR